MVPSLSLTTTSTWMSTSHHRSQEERTLTWISPSRIKAPSTSQTSHRALLSQLPVNDGSTIPNSRGGLLSMKTLSSAARLHNITSADDHEQPEGVSRPLQPEGRMKESFTNLCPTDGTPPSTLEEWYVLLHEFMHFAALVKPPLSMHPLDHAYRPWGVRILEKSLAA